MHDRTLDNTVWEEMREKAERMRKGEEAEVEQKGKRRRRIALLDD